MPVGSRPGRTPLKRPFIWGGNCVIIVWPPKALGTPPLMVWTPIRAMPPEPVIKKGSRPWSAPVFILARSRPGVLFRKAGGRADTCPRLYTERGCGPGYGVLYCFSPAPNRSPGASGPLTVWTSVQEKTAMPVFLNRKPVNYLGVWGQSPRRLFVSFLHAEKGCGRTFNILFGRMPHGMCGHTAT